MSVFYCSFSLFLAHTYYFQQVQVCTLTTEHELHHQQQQEGTRASFNTRGRAQRRRQDTTRPKLKYSLALVVAFRRARLVRTLNFQQQ